MKLAKSILVAYFLGIWDRNCVPRYVGGVLEFKKSDFMGLKCQFDVKKANFKGLIAKFSHLKPILASRTPLRSIFTDFIMGIVP